MSSVRAAFGAPERAELTRAAALAAGTALVAFLGVRQLGAAGILAPLALVLLLIVLQRPVGAMALLFVLTVVCEGPTFGFLHFTSHLYVEVYKGLTLLDMLVVVAILAVGLDVLGRRRAVYIPRPLMPMAAVLLLAMVAGAITGSAHGQSLRAVTLLQNLLAYLLLLPIAVANLDLNRRKIALFLGCVMALAAIKAVFGLIEIASGQGASIEGTARLTYYEPTANWLIMLSFFAVCAALVGKVRLPRWMLACSPLLLICLILSYRRSFWIAAVLGIVLVVLLGLSPTGRRVLVPAAVLVCVAVLLIGSVSVQSQSPVVKRFESLSPTKSRPERAGQLPQRRARERAPRYIRKPHQRPRYQRAVVGHGTHPVGRTRRRAAVRALCRALVLAEARDPWPGRLCAVHRWRAGALVESVARQRRARVSRLRVGFACGLARAHPNRGHRHVHRCRSALYRAGWDPARSIGAAGAWQTQCHESWRTCVGMERLADRAMRLLRTATRPRSCRRPLVRRCSAGRRSSLPSRLSRRSASGRVLGRGRNRRAGFHT